MKIVHFIIAVAIAAVVSAGQAEEIDTLPAQKVALAWLENVDAGGYGSSWDDAGELFRKAVARDAWEKTLANVRAPLGLPAQRKVRAVNYTRTLPGAPEGEYVVIQYQTLYGERSVIETVTPAKEPDGRWRVTGYFIR